MPIAKNKLIRIGNNHSPVFISDDPEKDFRRLWQLHIGTHLNTPVLVLVDETVWRHHQQMVDSWIASIPVNVLDIRKVSGGEASKQFNLAGEIIADWLNLPLTKDTVLICIGGGATTDLGGFLGSILKRGLRAVFVPTTLMAMTDASLGGKNALNFDNIKNQIGTFYFPLFTFVSPHFLQTLPAQEIKSGYAEILKHGFIDGKQFLNKILSIDNIETIPPLQILLQSIRIKMKIIGSDPHEKKQRLFLNLGHTFGHAYEAWFAASGAPITHGHAVALGLAEVLSASTQLCSLNTSLANAATKWLQSNFSFDGIPQWNQISQLVAKDKKNLSSSWRLVLIQEPGKLVIHNSDFAGLEQVHAAFLQSVSLG